MPARIHVNLLTDESRERISADKFLTALDASIEVLRELDTAAPGPRLKWYFTELAVGSGVAVLSSELDTATDAGESTEKEREIEDLFVTGLATIENSARLPRGFNRRAAEAALRLVSVLSDDVAQVVAYSPNHQPVRLTERARANLKEALGRGFTDIGSIEGRLETISLAGRLTFNVRNEVTGTPVTCTFKLEELDTVKEALGQRVVVSGEVTYSKRGEPSEISPVEVIRILGTIVPTVDEVRGIEPEITEGKPSGLYVRERFYGRKA